MSPRIGRCPQGHDLTLPDALYRSETNGARCVRCHRNKMRARDRRKRQKEQQIPDEIYEWAEAVWEAWTPHERAEFAGAMEVNLGRIRGAGDGTDARKRRRKKGEDWN